jgi:hypothetical protein
MDIYTIFSRVVLIRQQRSQQNDVTNKDNNKITELRTILQRESQNS